MIIPTQPRYRTYYMEILNVQSSKVFTLDEEPCSH